MNPTGFPSRTLAGMTPQPPDQQVQMERAIQAGMESCVGKSILSGVMGFALGGAFGLFMSSMSYDVPTALNPAQQALQGMNWRQQLKHGFKDMGARSYSSAKNFGMVGTIYAGTSCGIESLRARDEIKNHVAAGCITGGVLAAKAGPQAAGLGCAGFAAFSAAIETYLRQPSES